MATRITPTINPKKNNNHWFFKMRVIKIISLYILVAMLNSCGHSCQDWAEEFRPDSFKFKIMKKYKEGRYLVLEAENPNKGELRRVGWQELFDKATIGDTLVKIKGKTHVTLIQKDTSIVFLYYCKDVVVE
ncbi:hypothetical protein [Xanthocytophaga flava]|uniref:hypothetical protein n=1 Tax=Xanthocytophaga flava TaxID=3048013 RepID=UPI0028D02732|nr:hypothetical protein [Xanthocytophaga flavus]MDJ1473286.1 hypothetical protein [Xanthocytophaga flavus]